MSLLTNWEPSRLSDREAYRLFGYLSPDRMERLISVYEKVDVENIDPRVLNEARSCYPDEGFISDVLDRLLKVADQHEDPDYLRELCEELREIQDRAVRDGEYGREVIRDYQSAISEATS